MWKIYVCLLGYLSVETGSDIRKKEISVIRYVICGSAVLLLRIVMGLLRLQADAVQFLLTAILPFMSGLFLMFPVSLILLLSGKADRRAELPFAPFLLAAYLCWLMQTQL